jgi:hypothetical protein
MNFTQLAQKNVDHYNNHPTQHNAITIVCGVVAIAVCHKMLKRIAGVDKHIK